MIKKQITTSQQNLLMNKLDEIINLKHELCRLSEIIPWQELETELEKNYRKDFGRPAKPIRLMVSLLLLKQLHNLSDEQAVERWTENPYWQYFSGEEYFQWKYPCDPSELTKFRNRIGEQGIERIFSISIKLHGTSGMETSVIPDTTVQEKNITFPTDTKLHLKIIGRCLKMSRTHNIKLRQSYTRTLKKLRWSTRYLRNAKRAQEGRKAVSKIKTIAGRLFREIERKLPVEKLTEKQEEMEVMRRVLKQKRNDKNKIYSLHEPEVSCIAKGKDHKKYEFGSKASILLTETDGIIVGAKSFQGAPYDGHTLEPALEQSERLRGIAAVRAIVDEGYRGRSKIGETEVVRVHQPKKNKHNKTQFKKWFRRRASVEAAISHLKNNYGLDRNYLKGSVGDSINLMLSAAAYNIRKFLIKLSFIFRFLKPAFLLILFL